MTGLRAILRTTAALRLFALATFLTTGVLSVSICYMLRRIISIYFY